MTPNVKHSGLKMSSSQKKQNKSKSERFALRERGTALCNQSIYTRRHYVNVVVMFFGESALTRHQLLLLWACTCCPHLISRALPTDSIMADRLINIKVPAPGWCNRPLLNSFQPSKDHWCHLILPLPSWHVTVHLDLKALRGDAALCSLTFISSNFWMDGWMDSWQHRRIISTSCWSWICSVFI